MKQAQSPSPPGIQLITDNELCVSCGVCVHACPKLTIRMEESPKSGMVEAVIGDPAACVGCDAPCLDVCPSYEEDFIQLANWTDPSQRIGPWHKLYTCKSTSDEIRRRSSSGGIIRELCREALASQEVDGIITLSHEENLEYTPTLFRDVDTLLAEAPGSIYHAINFERALTILREEAGRFLLICTPCQLTAIRKWEQRCPEQRKGHITRTIGLMCGWLYNRKSIEHFGRYMGIAREDIRNATYRGGDAIGSFTLTTDEGQRGWFRRPNYGSHDFAAPYRVAFGRKYSCQRCLLCVEHLNYLADIVVGDAWLPRFEEDPLGVSIVVVRKAGAEAHLETLAAAGRIELSPATEDDVIASQGNFFAFGDEAQRIAHRLRREDEHFVPTFTVQNPIEAEPTAESFRKNWTEPRRQRAWIRRGLGYPRYRIQVLSWRLNAWFWQSPLASLARRIKHSLGK